MDINGAHIKPRIIVVTDGHLTEFDLVEGPDKPGGLTEMEMVCVFLDYLSSNCDICDHMCFNSWTSSNSDSQQCIQYL